MRHSLDRILQEASIARSQNGVSGGFDSRRSFRPALRSSPAQETKHTAQPAFSISGMINLLSVRRLSAFYKPETSSDGAEPFGLPGRSRAC